MKPAEIDLFQLLIRLARHTQKKLSGLRQSKIAAAVKQRTSDFFLQLLDVGRESRLGNVQRLGGARKMQQLGNANKVTNVAKFHTYSFAAKRKAREMRPPQARRYFALSSFAYLSALA